MRLPHPVDPGAIASHRGPGVAGERRGGGGGGGPGGPAVPPPTPSPPAPPPQPQRQAERRTHAVARVVTGIPEPSRAPVLEAIAQLATQGKPRDGPPLEPASHGPLRGDLLSGRVGGESQCESGERVGPKRAPASSSLDLVTQAVKGAASTQAVVDEDGESEPVSKRPTQASTRAEFVNVSTIAVVPAPEVELPPAAPTLRPERGWEDEERREPPGLSQPRQRRAAPPTCVAPYDGTRGAGLAA